MWHQREDIKMKENVIYAMRLLWVVLVLAALSPDLHAQQANVKINVLHAATVTPNLAFEIGLSEKLSLDVYAALNPFSYGDSRKWKHQMLQPELRYWFCDRFNGAFAGVHFHGGSFNVGNIGPFATLRHNRYEGYFFGAGVSYGYQWILSDRWGLELEGGLGYAHLVYDKFGCYECAPKLKSGHYNYLGPTKLQVSFLYFLW